MALLSHIYIYSKNQIHVSYLFQDASPIEPFDKNDTLHYEWITKYQRTVLCTYNTGIAGTSSVCYTIDQLIGVSLISGVAIAIISYQRIFEPLSPF